MPSEIPNFLHLNIFVKYLNLKAVIHQDHVFCLLFFRNKCINYANISLLKTEIDLIEALITFRSTTYNKNNKVIIVTV